MQLLNLQNVKIIKCCKSELGDYWLFWKSMLELNHSTDGAGNSVVPRLKVKGMNLVGVVSWSSRIR